MRPLPTRARVDDPPSRRASTLATATVLTAALTATLLGAIPAVAADPAAAGKAKEQLSEAAAQTKAKGEAKKSGKPVEIVSKRTLTDDVWANPDGTLTANQAMAPVRVHRGGKLVDVDTTLAKQSNGRIAPGATAVGLSFSGGGTAPLVTMTKDGRDVSLTWPKALPAPKLEGNSATYAEILEGVDLRVSADVNGFSHQIVVKNRKAAENPALATLDFGLEGKGVTIRKEANGELSAVDPAGKTLFSAAKPQMWDSGAEKPAAPAAAAAAPSAKSADPKSADPKTAAPKSSAPQALSGADVQAAPMAEAPAAQPPAEPAPAVEGIANGTKEADLGIDLKGSKLTLTPDRKLLTAAETTYPVVIDPIWRDDWKSSWAIAYKHNAFANSANTNYWNGGTLSKEGRVGCAKDGQNGNAVVCAKTFFQVGMGAVAGKQILSSTFRIQQTYAGSHSCDSGQLEIWDTDSIGGSTTWNNQPAWKRKIASIGDSYGGRNCPGNGDTVELNVTSAVAEAARWNWPAWTMGLKAAPETVDVSWRKFNPNSARISTQYNTLPVTPYERGTDPSVPCTGGAPIGTTDQVVLRARVADNEDNALSAEFHYWNANDYGTMKSVRVNVTSGNMAELKIPAAPLGSNTYRWDVRGNDGTGDGPWAGQCLFTIDATRPAQLPGVSSVQFPENQPDNTAFARTEGTFKLTSGGVNDITKYQWWTESDPKVNEAIPAKPGDPVDVKYTPPMAGPQVMYVRSLDASSNRSDLKSYLFYAKRQPVRDKPGDLNGDTSVDLWSVDPGSGKLWMHPGKGDGSFGLSKKLSHASFGDVKSLSHRNSWNEDYYEDLLALRPNNADASRNSLWVYPGKGDGDLQPMDANGIEVSVLDEENNNHWAQAEQVVSIGSVNDDFLPNQEVGDGKIDDSDIPDMLVKKGGELWLYFGTPVGFVDMPGYEPILLGNADWQNMTLMAPGDLNGDWLPEIWARDKVSGKIHQYTSKKTTTNTSPALIDLTVYRDPAVRTASIGTGFTGAAYPHLSTDGDFEKDGYADLWSRDGNGEITAFAGRVLTAGSAFGPGRKLVLGGTPWTECQAFTKPGTTTPRTLCGPILAKFLAMGGTAALGYPTSDVVVSTDAVGRFVHLRRENEGSDRSSLYWHPNTGAWTIVNGIREKWMSMGAETGVMGYPTSDEGVTFDRGSSFSTFTGSSGEGAIYWTPEHSSWSIRGGIYKKYIALGGPSGPLGYPTTDETNTADNIGRYNHFRHRGQPADTASIYWTADTGSWSVRGTIREKWVSLGAEKSFLGYPKSDEYDVYGGPREDFTGGYIRHNHTTGVSVEHKAADRTAHLRTDLSGDFNGDGRADLATVYDFGSETTALYVAPGKATGGFSAPVLAYNTGAWNWAYSRSQWIAGDFNGDGRDDLAALYDYGDSSNALFTFLGNADGTLTPAPRSAHVGAGNWDAKRAKLFAGDFNGDGRDDAGMMFDQGGCRTSTHTWLAKADGTFNHQNGSWDSGAGNWCWNESKHVAGDFNGDGRDDMLAMYGHSNGANEMYTLLGKTDGGLGTPTRSWNRGPGDWDYNRSKLTSGDYNGDGRADAAIMFDYGNGRSTLFTFTGKTDGGVNEDFASWSVPETSWYAGSLGLLVSGDNNKDGRDDLSVMYNYATGVSTAMTFNARADGGFLPYFKSWTAKAGTW